MTSRDFHFRLIKSGATCVITSGSMTSKVDDVICNCPSVRQKIVIPDGRDDFEVSSSWLNFNDLMLDAAKLQQSQVSVPTSPNDPMMIFFTSGTTGPPKMAEHSHISYGLASLITGKYWLDLGEDDIHWNLSDTGWAKAAWSNLFAPWICGACVFVHHPNSPGKPAFDPKSVLTILRDFPISTFCTAPTAYRLLVQENISDFTPFLSLRHVVSAGEPLNPEVIHSWHQATGLIIREGYGQTETVALTGNFKCIPNKPGSMGKPSPGMDVRVIDESGEVCPHGVEGDIALKVAPERPMGLFNGYVDEPTRTASAFRGNFYLTGDRGHVDEDGYIWFVGRSDDVIISSGYRIGPFEVESALLEHPDVVEAAVVSSPDVIRGEVVKAFVVLTSGCQKKIEASVEPEEDKKKLIKQLQDFVKNSTAPYKYPRKVEIVTALPKTISGKIRRVELRQKEWGRGMAVNN